MMFHEVPIMLYKVSMKLYISFPWSWSCLSWAVVVYRLLTVLLLFCFGVVVLRLSLVLVLPLLVCCCAQASLVLALDLLNCDFGQASPSLGHIFAWLWL